MDEAWERAVETALEGQADSSSAPRTLTLDGAVKCLQGRLPPPGLLERYQSLEHLSIANIGVSSLEKFPRLRNLQRLILSDNRISGGLEFLVEAGLDSLRDLDLSNNRIQFLEDLAPLAQLRLVSLDLYECPVTRIKDYRSRVFGMIRTLKYLDKMDADENERPETDDDEEDEEDDEEEEDPGSGEVDGGDRSARSVNGVGGSSRGDAVVDVDEDEESDADEEETETGRRVEANGFVRGSHHHLTNGFRVAPAGAASIDVEDEEEEEDVEDDDEEEEDLVDEIDEDEGEDDDVVEVHDVGDSDEDADGVEEDGEEEVDEEEVDEEDGVGDEDEEDVEDEEDDGERGSTGRLMSMEGEIDGHEQGEEDENGEIGEEYEQGVEVDREYEERDGEDEDEEEDFGTEYLVQPIAQPVDETGGSDFDACNAEDEDEIDEEEDNLNNGILPHLPPSPQHNKRKRDEDDDSVEDLRSSKHH